MWKKSPGKKMFLFLWVACILGSWAVIPYVHYLGIVDVAGSVWKTFLLGTLQAAVFFGVICWISYKILPKTDLRPFRTDEPLRTIVYPGVISGVLVGVAIFLSDITVFKSSLLMGVHPPFWAGALASIYGAVNEEVLLRLFLFTLVYFTLNKIFSRSSDRRLIFLWITNIFVALLFGVGHLPAAFKLTPPSVLEVSRVLFLNGIAGLVFGWLYWSRGLWAAMAAHFMTDIIIHVFLV